VNVNEQYGLQIRRLKHGGYLVCHPDIYILGALFFAATTIDEAFTFIRGALDRPEDDVTLPQEE
jgi:hypothetical protein